MAGTTPDKFPSLVLNGHGFSLRLTMVEESPSGRFIGQAAVLVDEPMNATLSANVDFPIADLERLSDWIDDHLGRLAASGVFPIDRRVWVPLDLSLQVELLDGEVERISDGLFEGNITVSVFVNLGTANLSGFALYQGVQGVLEVTELVHFCGAVRELIASRSA
jgi:hypothetical protein